MAVNKTINIDINQNADEAAKGFDNLNKSLDETNESIRDVNATFEEVYGELQPLTTRLGEAEDRLYELALAGDTTSKEYQELLKTVANYRKVQIQTDATVDAAATTLDQKLGGAIQGAVSGFAAVQGAMGLLGSESEQLEKTLLKVQSALAIAEGVRGIRENIGYFKQLGSTVSDVFKSMTTQAKIFTATGIGLAITAVATLTDLFKDTTSATTDYRKAVDQTNAVTAKAVENAANELSALDRLQGTLENETLTRQEKNEAVDELQKKYPELLKNVSAEKLSIEELNSAVANNIKLSEARARISAAESLRAEKFTSLLQEEIKQKKIIGYLNDELREQGLKELDVNASLNEIYKAESDLIREVGVINLSSRTRQARKSRERLDALQKEIQEIDGITEADERLLKSIEKTAETYEDAEKKKVKAKTTSRKQISDLSRQIEDEQIKRIADEEEREIKLLETTAKRRKEDLAKQLKERTVTAKQESALRTEIETNLELDIQAVRDKFAKQRREEEIARLKEIEDLRLKTGKEAIQSLNDQLNKELELRIAAAEKEKQIEAEKAALRKRNQEFAVESTKQSLDIIISLTEIFGKKSEKAARRAFNIQKGAQIASATIDTYKNAVSAYGSQFVPVPDPSSPVRGGIAAGIAVAAGLANIAKIASQKFEGGGGGGTVAEPSTAGLDGAGAVTPQFNVVGDSGINQLAQLQQQPVQAYVVSGEVTSAQALDRNRVQNATL
jgi:hypothetical protein